MACKHHNTLIFQDKIINFEWIIQDENLLYLRVTCNLIYFVKLDLNVYQNPFSHTISTTLSTTVKLLLKKPSLKQVNLQENPKTYQTLALKTLQIYFWYPRWRTRLALPRGRSASWRTRRTRSGRECRRWMSDAWRKRYSPAVVDPSATSSESLMVKKKCTVRDWF